MVLAEELEVPLERVDMIMGDTELCPYDAGTWGSLTTRFTDPVLRAAAAEAREILKKMAGEELGVATSELVVENGVVMLKKNKAKKVSYEELTKGKKIVQTLSVKTEIKKAENFKIIGKPVISMDAMDKVTGKAKYSGDIQLPGMVYASIVRPTVYGAEAVAVDTSGLSGFDGVEVIEDGSLIAVVHKDPEVASRAAKKVKVKWNEPESKANDESIFDYLDKTLKDSRVFEEGGNLEEGKNSSTDVISLNYEDGYKAHATIETHSATCYFEGDKLTMWVSTQTPFGTRQQVANALNITTDEVHIKQIFIGGGFGGKAYNNQAIEVAKIASKVKKPVQLVWTRKEEFMYDQFRTAALMKSTAGVDKEGRLKLWEFDIYCAGSRGTKLFYDIPNNRTRLFNASNIHQFGTGAWRAPGNNSTTFARESHIDVIAHKVGIDPLKFRMMNMKPGRMSKTLELAANTFGWNKPKKDGIGYGIALGEDAGTTVAMIAEVFVDKKTGNVEPARVVCAQDMGQVVNPHGAILQTEGGITMGIGYALFEDIKFDGGKILSNNFSNYEITRFSTTPKIECVFVDKMDAKPEGGGEPAIICVGAAIANAVFDACGSRVTRMPLTPERVLENI
jgi:isoquinoline 1-oxidoreductase